MDGLCQMLPDHQAQAILQHSVESGATLPASGVSLHQTLAVIAFAERYRRWIPTPALVHQGHLADCSGEVAPSPRPVAAPFGVGYSTQMDAGVGLGIPLVCRAVTSAEAWNDLVREIRGCCCTCAEASQQRMCNCLAIWGRCYRICVCRGTADAGRAGSLV